MNFRPAVGSSDGPVFDNSLVTNVTAQFGGTAYLQCKVLNIKSGEDNVSTIFWYVLLSKFSWDQDRYIFKSKKSEVTDHKGTMHHACIVFGIIATLAVTCFSNDCSNSTKIDP